MSTWVGYTGGTNSRVTYRNHHGHAEAIEIIFDPGRARTHPILAMKWGVGSGSPYRGGDHQFDREVIGEL
jgi:peptide methionine sulfoxide reductase MsrA